MDIRFSRTLNSCKLPQIRYASPERLFERLTDLRFLSIDFLNTFLLTYRVFTDGVTVLEALKRVHYNPELQLSSLSSLHDSSGSLDDIQTTAKNDGSSQMTGDLLCTVDYDYSRRISTGSMITDINDLHRESVVSNSDSTAGQQLQQLQQMQAQQICQMSRNSQHWRLSYRKCKRFQFTEWLIMFVDFQSKRNRREIDILEDLAIEVNSQAVLVVPQTCRQVHFYRQEY